MYVSKMIYRASRPDFDPLTCLHKSIVHEKMSKTLDPICVLEDWRMEWCENGGNKKLILMIHKSKGEEAM